MPELPVYYKLGIKGKTLSTSKELPSSHLPQPRDHFFFLEKTWSKAKLSWDTGSKEGVKIYRLVIVRF